MSSPYFRGPKPSGKAASLTANERNKTPKAQKPVDTAPKPIDKAPRPINKQPAPMNVPDYPGHSGTLGPVGHLLHNLTHPSHAPEAVRTRNKQGKVQPRQRNVSVGEQAASVIGVNPVTTLHVLEHPVRFIQHQQHLTPQQKANSAIGAHLLGSLLGAPAAGRIEGSVARAGSVDQEMKKIGATRLHVDQNSRPDLYMRHPKSGYMVRNSKPRPAVIPDYGNPPRIQDTVPAPHRMGNEVPVAGSVRPPAYVYRAVSEDEYQAAKKSGYFKSDGRMNLGPHEGTVAALSDPTYYLPGKLASSPFGDHLGRVIRIKYQDADGWLLDHDGYVKTQRQIPFGRVDRAPRFVTTKGHIKSSVTGNPIEHISTRPYGETTLAMSGGGDEAKAEAKAALRSSLRGAKVVRGKQEAGYAEERAARFAKARTFLNDQSLEPEDRLRLAKNELKGELPKIDFQGMKVLDEQSVKELQKHILDHPFLMEGQKIRASDALSNALMGKVPTTGELQLLEHVFGKDTASGIGRIAAHPMRDLILSTLNVPRSMMASFDLSAPFRQGLVVSTRHPVLFAKNFAPMVKSFGSERVYQSVLSEIHARPTYPMMMEAKLAITELTKNVGLREEHFASDVAEKIPVIGRGIRASGRAYTGFLDKLRADQFDHLIQRAQSQGINVQDPEFLKSLGKYINSATGRGDLGHFQEAGKVLNTFFFSPRLLASRLNFMNPFFYARLDPFARKEALRSAFQLAGTLSTLLALASQIPGVKVVLDPRNPDWGKIKRGNTRIDIGGGFQQPLRLFAQLATGVAISSTTGKKLNLTANGFGQPTRLDLLLRFFEGKEAPWASFVTDKLRNSDQVGNKFQLGPELYSRMVPLLAQDTLDVYHDRKGGMNGIAAAFAGYGIGAVGFGLQTYGPKQPKPSRQDSNPYFGGSGSSPTSPYFQGDSGSSGSSPYFSGG